MDEAMAKDRLIEEMRENERLRARVAELEAEIDDASSLVDELEARAAKWERASHRLAGEGLRISREGLTVTTAENLLAWALGE